MLSKRLTLMPDPRRRRLMLAASVLFAMVPVVFGVIRAVNTGADVRYFWLAGAAILGSIAIMPPRRGAAGHAGVSLPRAVGAVAAGAICAGLVAIAMGAKAGPGIAIVAIAFGLCTGASAIFATLARLDSMSGLTDDPFNDGRQREGAEGE